MNGLVFSVVLTVVKWCPRSCSDSRLAAILQHYACQKLNFYEANFFFIINFQKEKANTFTILIILIVKSLQIELHITNLLL